MKTHPFLQRFCVAGLFVVAMAHALVLTGQTNVSINATGAVAHPSAILDVSSTTSGLLLPRMTHAEKMAIATPTDGLMIYQIGGGDGIWYYDSSENAWVMLSRYLSGNVAMGDPPSVVMQGKGFTVTRLAVGTDEITLNEPMQYGPSVIMSSSQSDGSAPFLEDYCTPEFTTCGCHQILNFGLYGGISAGATPIIENMASGCNGEPDMYKYYPPGDPVYVMSGSPDLCAGVADKYTLLFRGTVDNTACEVHRVYIWLDWQQDGFFDELNDQLVSTNTVDWGGGNQVLGNQTIPASAYCYPSRFRCLFR